MLLLLVTITHFKINFQSVTFRKSSRNLARSMFWKNVKMYVILGVALIVSIFKLYKLILIFVS